VEPNPLASSQRAADARCFGLLRPFGERRHDGRVENIRPLFSPVFPRKVAIPGLERSACGPALVGALGARQRKIADRDDVGPGVAWPRVSAAITKRIELFDVSKRKAGLLLHPLAQADLERAVRNRIERTKRQASTRLVAATAACDQNAR